MSWKFICPSNCPLVTSRPPPPSLPPSALIIRDRTLPFPSLRFHFRDVGVVESGGGKKRRIGTNFQDEEGTAAPSRDRLSSALSREIATIEITSGAEGGRRDSDEFSFMLKEPPSTPTTIRAETSHFASHPPCLPPPFYFLYSPYTRAHPFASLNLHYFNVALCPTLPFDWFDASSS